MRNTTFAISIVLTLISGFLLSQLWTLEPMSLQSIPAGTDAQTEATAASFYEAVNSYLSGGDDAEVRRLLRPEFLTHQPGGAWTGTGDDLLRRLDSVRQLFPGIRLDPELVALGNSTVSVTLSTNSHRASEFAGISIDPADIVGRLDLVRVERGLIAEHWSSAEVAGQLVAYPALSIDLPSSIDALVARVQQIPLDNDPGMTMRHARHMLLIVASGQAFLELASPVTTDVMLWQGNHRRALTTSSIETASVVELGPTEAVYLPAWTSFSLWDSITEDTTLIALEFGQAMTNEVIPTAPFLRAMGETLWSGVTLEEVGEHLTISFGQATLLPQAILSSQNVAGIELAWIAGGSLEMTGFGGEARVRKASGTRSQLIDGRTLLAAGDTAAAGPGSDTSYENSKVEPATAWFISLVPAPENSDDLDAEPDPTPIPTAPPIRFHT